MYIFLVSITLYTWTVLALPHRLDLTTTTSLGGFALPLPSSARTLTRYSGRRAFVQQAIRDEADRGAETKSVLSSSVDPKQKGYSQVSFLEKQQFRFLLAGTVPNPRMAMAHEESSEGRWTLAKTCLEDRTEKC